MNGRENFYEENTIEIPQKIDPKALEEHQEKPVESGYMNDQKGLFDKIFGKFSSRKLLVFAIATAGLFLGFLDGPHWCYVAMTYISTQAAVDIFSRTGGATRGVSSNLTGGMISGASSLIGTLKTPTEPLKTGGVVFTLPAPQVTPQVKSEPIVLVEGREQNKPLDLSEL
jgi:hypothetical protein